MKKSFSNIWAFKRMHKTGNKFATEKSYVLGLPHYQKVAKIAGDKKRTDQHRRSCQDAYIAKTLYEIKRKTGLNELSLYA